MQMSRKWQEKTANFWKRMKAAGNDRKWLEMSGNGWKCLKMAKYSRKLMEMAKIAGNG